MTPRRHRIWEMSVKKFLIAGCAVAAFCGAPAFAADMAVKAPPPPPVSPAWSWTGFYVGVNAGGSIGRNPSTQSDTTSGEFLGSFTMSPSGFVGGGQIGYNYQFAPNWVIGVEADLQGTTERDSNCLGDGCAHPGLSFYTTAEQKLEWFATARARLGYTKGDWLWYVTGGGAWAEIHNDFRVFDPGDIALSANFNLSGWVIGGGVETHLWGPWTAKLEYLYMDLGSFTDSGHDPVTGDVFAMTSNVRDHIIRAGLNYKFY
jgi:outer membrane immunogenic protein